MSTTRNAASESGAQSPVRILGIDPGLRITGFGVIDKAGQKLHYVASGCIKTPEGELPGRLKVILDSLREVIEQHRPQRRSRRPWPARATRWIAG